MFDQIGLLVLEGDAAGLAAKVSELSAIPEAGPTRISRSEPEAAAVISALPRTPSDGAHP